MLKMMGTEKRDTPPGCSRSGDTVSKVYSDPLSGDTGVTSS